MMPAAAALPTSWSAGGVCSDRSVRSERECGGSARQRRAARRGSATACGDRRQAPDRRCGRAAGQRRLRDGRRRDVVGADAGPRRPGRLAGQRAGARSASWSAGSASASPCARCLADRGVRRVVVAEIEEALVDWHRDGARSGRRRSRPAARRPARRGRGRRRPRRSSTLPRGRSTSILLDVDNGPGYLVYDANAAVYATGFLTTCARSARAGGIARRLVCRRRRPCSPRFDEVFARVEELDRSRSSSASGRRRYHLFVGTSARPERPGLIVVRPGIVIPEARAALAVLAVERSRRPVGQHDRLAGRAELRRRRDDRAVAVPARAGTRAARRPAGRRRHHDRGVGAPLPAAQPRGGRAAAGADSSARRSRRHRHRAARPADREASVRAPARRQDAGAATSSGSAARRGD